MAFGEPCSSLHICLCFFIYLCFRHNFQKNKINPVEFHKEKWNNLHMNIPATESIILLFFFSSLFLCMPLSRSLKQKHESNSPEMEEWFISYIPLHCYRPTTWCTYYSFHIDIRLQERVIVNIWNFQINKNGVLNI